VISVVMIGYMSCKDKMETDQFSFLSEIPGTNIDDMAMDNNHVLYFVTSEFDREVEVSVLSSFRPRKGYLSRKTNATGKFDFLGEYYPERKLCFDKKNQLLTFDAQAIYRLDGKLYHKIFELSDNDDWSKYLAFIAVDNDNNIWTGGIETGLYKIDSQLNVTHYHVNNSELPTNNMRAIHINKNNNDIWIVLGWMGTEQRILKISNGQWTFYNASKSEPDITSLVTDKNGHLWIGTGWGNENQKLMRFDGTRWETVHPRNDKNEITKGIVRCIQSDGNKIYIVSSQYNDSYYLTNELLIFDGVKWDKVSGIPEDDWIGDLIVDDHRQVVWVWTSNKGIYKIPYF
jgi:sugar lactone lactonase YvrE